MRRMFFSFFLFAAVFLVAVTPIFAEGAYDSLLLTLPVIDAPYNFSHGGRFPSMSQSGDITKDFYEVVHRGFAQGGNAYPKLSLIASGFCDLFLYTYLPGGNSWLHEEYHRAVMGQYGINSYNDIYNMKIGAEFINVSHEKDSDLQFLKDNHPADMVRLDEAGIEGEYEWIRSSREDFFFSRESAEYERVAWILSVLNSSVYIYTCTTDEADTMTDEANKEENDIDQRDFTGLDFTAWVYDLYRPNEPYAARGTHPLGNGYDRYIKYSDLSPREKKYLKKQFRLALLNFVSPQFYGFDSFDIESSGGTIRLNMALMHYLTSFGSSTEVHLLSAFSRYNLVTVLRLYQNESLSLPGAELRAARLAFGGLPFLVDAGISVWLQPKDQMFHEKHVSPGAGSDIKFTFPVTDLFEVYAMGGVKSCGWQAGKVSLGKGINGETGMQMKW